MNYTFLPSLEHIVLVKIATSLWNQSDIRALIVILMFEYPVTFLENIEEKIKERVLLLNTPSSLKEKILCVIKPIGTEIYHWMRRNKKFYNLAVNLPDEFSWTPHGTIDGKKTAEALMTDETIDIAERYKLACIYCLENYVGALWEEMPEKHRASFYNEKDPRKVAQNELVVIWTYGIKGETAKLEKIVRWRVDRGECTPEQYPLKCAFLHHNKVAAEYFWSKLSREDREDSLNWVTGRDFNAEVPECSNLLRFLLSRMNKEQQIAFFEKCSCQVLECFLQWPWQSLFMDMTNHVVVKNFYYLLNSIVLKVYRGYKDYDYQRLFGEFWQKSTEDHKKDVIDNFCNGCFTMLLNLFENKDMKNISLILKDASVLEKAALYKSIGLNIFFNLYREKEFDCLELFINEFISSHEMLIKLKDKYMKKYPLRHDDGLKKFFDDLIQKFNLKKNIEESHCSSAKRLCSSSDM